MAELHASFSSCAAAPVRESDVTQEKKKKNMLVFEWFLLKWPLKESELSRDPPVPPPLTVHTGRSGSCSSSDLALLTGTAGRLPGDGPPWLAAVPVQRHNLTCPRCQLAWKWHCTTEREVREMKSYTGQSKRVCLFCWICILSHVRWCSPVIFHNPL